MSYIRCLCNPESLYVFGSVGDHHDFSWTDRNGDMQQFSIPSEDFDEFFKRFHKWNDWTREDYHELDDEIFEYKGIQIRTVWFNEKLKRIMTAEEVNAREFGDGVRVNHLICLTYKDNLPLLMWEVTWDRLRESAYDHLFWPCWFVRKINKWFGHGNLRQ